jgi:hypothetical protein
MSGPAVSVVIPTIGRSSLTRLLQALQESYEAADGQPRPEVVLVDDRAKPDGPLPTGNIGDVKILMSFGRGPAAARNVGWRAASSEWIAFLDDDVVPSTTWLRDLTAELGHLPSTVAASQGQLVVPLPAHRRPTDWERCTAGLEQSAYITADMAYRRDVLTGVGGFDERFRRAYREDTDLAMRVQAAGWQIASGQRRVTHPVRPSGPWASVRAQRGNADDRLMRRLHGRSWRQRGRAPRGRLRRHAAVTGAAAAALLAAASGRRLVALAAGAVWLVGTSAFAAERIAAGPKTARELATMTMTSIVIPPVACARALQGQWCHRSAKSWPRPCARNGTLPQDASAA